MERAGDKGAGIGNLFDLLGAHQRFLEPEPRHSPIRPDATGNPGLIDHIE
jgi:hypothetical protein